MGKQTDKEAVSSLMVLPGIGKATAQKLEAAGITTPSKLHHSSMKKLDSVGVAGLADIRKAAKEYVEANRKESAVDVVFAHRVKPKVNKMNDGSYEVDYDDSDIQFRKKGLYILASDVIGGRRDDFYKVGMTEDDVLIERVQKADNVLNVREILSDLAYRTRAQVRPVFYFIPCANLSKHQIESLESHLTSLIAEANPKHLMKQKVREGYKASLNFGAGIGGIVHDVIGAGKAVAIKGLTAARRADAAMLARSLGLGDH